MKYFLALVIILAFLGGAWYAWDRGLIGTATVSNELIWHHANSNDILVSQPTPGSTVPHSFAVSGSARGGWYFEASFPIQILDKDGNELFQAPVQAQGDWMTADFVPFGVSVSIPNEYSGRATIILKNDNPSGLPENERSVSIPVVINN